MPKYTVNVREVHIQMYEVVANSPEEAKEIVEEGGGDVIQWGLEFSHTLPSDTWTVEKDEPDGEA